MGPNLQPSFVWSDILHLQGLGTCALQQIQVALVSSLSKTGSPHESLNNNKNTCSEILENAKIRWIEEQSARQSHVFVVRYESAQ